MSKEEKDLPSPSGEGKLPKMESDTLPVTWTIDWGENGEPDNQADDLHYDQYGNVIKENGA